LKILTLNSHDSSGGAARAAYNLYRGLQNLGLDSRMLVSTKASEDYGVIGPNTKLKKMRSLFSPYIDDLPKKYFSSLNENLHSPAWYSNIKADAINKINPDIFHLHWVQGGYLSVKTISKLNKPIVWTLHDMWPFSGAEHYSNGSFRFKEGYNINNRPEGESGFDLNRWVWKRKKKAWSKIRNLTVVAPSNWMAECARESILFKDRRVEVIHVGLDHTLYRPRDKDTVRRILGMPLDKKIILIGAMNFLKDKRKGGHLIKRAFENLVNQGLHDNAIVYILGTSVPKIEENFGFETYYYGSGRDDLSLALLYSAVDVFVAPSIEENFSATVFESLSCGTPVVAFNIGGMPDMIMHNKNGYLAEPFDTDDLANGIQWVLNDSQWEELSKNAREYIKRECTLEIQAKRYKKIYEEIIN
jgi:glycosyltransferase involved in cell wall biosynthesis